MRPISGGPGTVVTIWGTGFQSVAGVGFDNRPLGFTRVGSFTKDSPTKITAVIGNTPTWGTLTFEYNAFSRQEYSNFNFSYPTAPPYLDSVSVGIIGTLYRGLTITILGDNLTTTRRVRLGGDTATRFTVINEHKIEAVVGRVRNYNGFIYVQTDYGVDSIAGPAAMPPYASVIFFTPTYGKQGDTITVRGQDLDYAAGVTFGGVPATAFSVVSEYELKAKVGAGATGVVAVTAQGGARTQTSAVFTYVAGKPDITSFTPTVWPGYNFVTLYGTGLQFATEVYIAGAPAKRFGVQPDNSLWVEPGNVSSMNDTIIVRTADGGGDTITGFRILNVSRADSIRPAKGHVGDTVVIYGSKFTQVSDVRIGTPKVPYFQMINDSVMRVVIGYGNSGPVFMTGGEGIDSARRAFFTIIPEVKNFTPTSGYADDSVTIKGSGFTGATAASVGGVPVKYLYVRNDSTAGFRVGAGATGSIRITTPSGTDSSRTVFTFLYGAPDITSFNPVSATRGQMVTIYGNRFTDNVQQVYFGNVLADSFRVINNNFIEAWVGKAKSGDVRVSSSRGMDSLAGFTFIIPEPEITSFTPKQGRPGSIITITGKNLDYVTSAGYAYGSTSPSFNIISASRIDAVVGDIAIGSPSVWVRTENGYDSLWGFTWLPSLLKIKSFSPASGFTGDSVTVKGISFTGVTSATVGGVAAESLRIYNDSTLGFRIAQGATGSIVLTSLSGKDTSAATFNFVRPQPDITSFNPTSAKKRGDTVLISGSGLRGVTAVTVGKIAPDSFRIISDQRIKVWLGVQQSGFVKVIAGNLADSLGGFEWRPLPHLDSVSPGGLLRGQTITILGDNLATATTVRLGRDTATSVTVINDHKIQAVVGRVKNYNGFIYVQTYYGIDSIAGPAAVSPYAAPLYFTPTSGKQGDTITVRGYDLDYTAGVTLGGVPAAAFSVVNESELKVKISNGATGVVALTAQGGGRMQTSAVFTYLGEKPVITSFTPASGYEDDSVTIKGSGFTGATFASIGGVPVKYLYVRNDSTAGFRAGAGVTGAIRLTTPAGTDTSRTVFRFIEVPEVIYFNPATAIRGDAVTIYGKGFTNIQRVSFGKIAADSFQVLNNTTIKAWVGTGATGDVKVGNLMGIDSLSGFTFIEPQPQLKIKSFSPASGFTGDSVTVKGLAFTGTTLATVGGAAVQSLRIYNDSTAGFRIGQGATGRIVLTGSYGKDSSATSFNFVRPQPDITSFNPTTVTVRDTLIISGTGLRGVTAVTLGRITPDSFRIVSDQRIKVWVGTHQSGFVKVIAGSLVDSLGGFVWLPPIPVPLVTSVTPSSAMAGEQVVIRGSGLSGATEVRFGTKLAASYTVVSATQINAIVDSGATGKIKVITPGGRDSSVSFTYLQPVPQVVSFTPAAAAPVDTVLIYGKRFRDVLSVTFGGVQAGSYRVVNDTLIRAVVGSGASGSVSVTTKYGTGQKTGFTYIGAGTVNLATFSAVLSGDKVQIQWKTSKEKYTDHFILGWTAGAETVLQNNVPGAGFSDTTRTYSFTYPATKAGRNLVQLSMYDRMGNTIFVDSAAFNVNAELFPVISSYPNPVSVNGSTTIKHPASAGPASIMMFNMNGSLVQTQAVNPGDVRTTVYFHSLPRGMYKMVWTNGSISKSSTIMLQ
jgi:hypothetical protein